MRFQQRRFGRELAYAEKLADQTVVAFPGGAITGLSITFDPGGLPYMVELVIPTVHAIATAGQFGLVLGNADNSVSYASKLMTLFANDPTGAAFGAGSVEEGPRIVRRFPASSGVITRAAFAYSPSMRIDYANFATPAFIRAIEVVPA